jgi:hypothetical protein
MAQKTTASAIRVQRNRRRGSEQTDLFASPLAAGAPDWVDLPKDAQGALLGLMTRLILDHARATGEAGHDR